MKGKPFRVAGAINLPEKDDGPPDKELKDDFEISLSDMRQDELFIIEFVGINAFAQNGQALYFAIQVLEEFNTYIYSIAPTGIGIAPWFDDDYSAQVFGSQPVRLYVRPSEKEKLIVTFGRSNRIGKARAYFDLSGRIITP